MVDAAAQRPPVPGIDDIERQWRVHRDRRMQARRRLPGLEAHSRHRLAGAAGLGHRQRAAVAGNHVPARHEAAGLELQPLHGGVDVANRATGRAFLAQHVPRLQRLTNFQRDATIGDLAEHREAEFELRLVPFLRKLVAGVAELGEHALKILPEIMRQHEAVVQRGAPAREAALLRLAPHFCDQRADQELLREAHPRIGRHLQRTEFDQAEPAGGAVRRIELVDADLGAMGIAGDVDQDVPEQPVDQPQRRLHAGWRHLRQRDLQFIQTVMPCLVDARRLAGRADEHAGEQIGQAGMALPVQHQALQQIGPAQERRIRGRAAADHDMIAAAGAGVAAIDQKAIGAQPRPCRVLIQERRGVDGLAPGGGGMDVDLQHAGIGRHLDDLDARIVGRRIALDVNLQLHLFGGRFQHRDQFEIVLQLLDRRHERAQYAVADFDRHCGPHRAAIAPILLDLVGRSFRPRGRLDILRRQIAARLHRVPLDDVGEVVFRHVRQGGDRQPQAERGIAGGEKQVAAA